MKIIKIIMKILQINIQKVININTFQKKKLIMFLKNLRKKKKRKKIIKIIIFLKKKMKNMKIMNQMKKL